MKNSLLKKLVAVIIASVFFIAAANAQIVYTDVNPDHTFTDSGSVYNLDLNNDGMVDYEFYIYKSTVKDRFGHCSGSKTDYSVQINPLNNNEVLHDSSLNYGYYYPAKLSLTTILYSKTNKWESSSYQTNQTLVGLNWGCYSKGGGFFWLNIVSGEWEYAKNKYLGLKVHIGSNIYFGWVRLSVISYPFLTIQDYAYNSMPNQPILAGETSCTTPTVILHASGSLSFCAGDSVTLKANGTGYLYEWKKNGKNIKGATAKTYVAKTAGTYKCKVSNSCGAITSSGVNVTVTCFTANAVTSSDKVLAGQTSSAATQVQKNEAVNDNIGVSIQTSSFIQIPKVDMSNMAALQKVTGDKGSYELAEQLRKRNHSLISYPNPFTNSTAISFTLPQSQKVSLEIFDMEGRLIKIFADAQMQAGTHQLMWNAKDEKGNAVSAGIYFLKMQTEKYVETKKLSVIK